MKAVIQRVSHASVEVDGKIAGSCERGYLILLGVAEGDTELDAELLCKKIAALRIFRDENEKMNLSIRDIDGEALVISQFTLLANYRHGNRPDFCATAAPPAVADALYTYFMEKMRAFVPVSSGRFGADMEVTIVNDGPVTFVLESDVLLKK